MPCALGVAFDMNFTLNLVVIVLPIREEAELYVRPVIKSRFSINYSVNYFGFLRGIWFFIPLRMLMGIQTFTIAAGLVMTGADTL